MARKGSTSNQTTAGRVLRERPTAKVPIERPVSRVPRGAPMSRHVPASHVARVPALHPVGPPPNLRRPKLVRDVRGGVLRDLFEFFPDLPRPFRPPARVPLRVRRLRLRRT